MGFSAEQLSFCANVTVFPRGYSVLYVHDNMLPCCDALIFNEKTGKSIINNFAGTGCTKEDRRTLYKTYKVQQPRCAEMV